MYSEGCDHTEATILVTTGCRDHSEVIYLLVGRVVIIICSLLLQVSIGIRELITQQYTNLLSNSKCQHKRNVLLAKDVA